MCLGRHANSDCDPQTSLSDAHSQPARDLRQHEQPPMPASNGVHHASTSPREHASSTESRSVASFQCPAAVVSTNSPVPTSPFDRDTERGWQEAGDDQKVTEVPRRGTRLRGREPESLPRSPAHPAFARGTSGDQSAHGGARRSRLPAARTPVQVAAGLARLVRCPGCLSRARPRIGDYDEPQRRVRLRASTTKTRQALWVELLDSLAEAI
jgi:hypothetical protein